VVTHFDFFVVIKDVEQFFCPYHLYAFGFEFVCLGILGFSLGGVGV
jgi:hypothetical protein